MKVVTRIMLGFVAILLCGITACQVHYYKARRTPAVSGKVVDIETGEPIKGADVSVQVFGFPSDPIAAIASPPKWQLAGDMLKTDSQGSFSFPSQVPPLKDSGVSPLSYIIWGPDEQIGLGINVFSKEHITVSSQTDGFEWTTDELYLHGPKQENGENAIIVSRKKIKEHEYQYTIKIKRAVTEMEWESKCGMTILHTGLGMEPDSEWLFRDLVGYLERYPEGKKAGDYALLLLDRIAKGDSPRNIDEEIDKKYLDKRLAKRIVERNQKILEVTSKIASPEYPRVVLTFSNYNKRRESVKKCTLYLQEKLLSGDEK